MSDSIKVLEQRFGFKKTSAWNTATEPSTNDGLFVIGGSHVPPNNARVTTDDGDEHGRLMRSQHELLQYEEQSGTFSVRGHYEGTLEKLCASIMGHYDTTTAETTVITHKCKADPQIADILHTIGWEEGAGEMKGVASAVIKSLEFVIDNGLRVNVEYLGDKVQELSGTWTDATDWTYSSIGKGLHKLIGCTVLMNNESGATLNPATDEINPSNITIRLERMYETPPPGTGQEYASQPNENGSFLVTVSMEFPKKDTTNAAYFSAWSNNTAKKMSIVFTGDTISGKTAAYSLGFYFPKLHISEAPVYELNTPVPNNITLTGFKSNDTLTENINRGMEEIYPYIKIVNEVAALTGYPAESTS